MADNDWSNWQVGVTPPQRPRREGGVSVASSVGLLLVLAALLMIAAGMALAVISDRTGGLGLQGRLTLAGAGANAPTALLLMAGMVLVRPSIIGRGRSASAADGGGLTVGAGVLGSIVVLLAGGYDFVAAFTDRPVLSGILGGFSVSYGSSSPSLPVNYHLSAMADGLAVLLLGAAAVKLAFRALAAD